MSFDKCRYAEICKHYNALAHTCHDENEAKTYCGTYSQLKDLVKIRPVKIPNMR